MAKKGQRQTPALQPRGRPPSYPAVVTTTTTNNDAGYAENIANSSANNADVSPPTEFPSADATMTPPSLEAAMRLYERDGDAIASLNACQGLWNTDGGRAEGEGVKVAATRVGKQNSGQFETTDTSVLPSRQHNQVVLEHLSSLRSQRRRVRRRPSSFDEGGDAAEAEGGEPEDRVENLAAVLSSVLTISSENKPLDKDQSENNAVPTKFKENKKRKEQEKNVVESKEQLSLSVYNQLVGLYNVCLANYADGNHHEALNAILGPFINAMNSVRVDAVGVSMDMGEGNEKMPSFSPMSYLVMMTRVAFLVLDCQFALNGGNGMGLGPIVANVNGDSISVTMEDILAWVEKKPLDFSSKVDDLTDLDESIKPDELKFRLHLYRSRMLFVGNHDSGEGNGHDNDAETRTRISRKELKNAMDIYQNKLCVVVEGEKEYVTKGTQSKHGESRGGSGDNEGGSAPNQSSTGKGKNHQDVSETTSVTSMAGGSLVTSASDALWSEGKGGTGVTRATFEDMPNKNTSQQQQAALPSSAPAKVKVKKDTPNLQVRHESVLYLKANLEHLRGNTIKSLKLCAEARLAGKKSRAERNGDEKETIHGDSKSGIEKENGSQSHATVAEEGTEAPSCLDGEIQMANDYDEAIYFNNLALLHQSAGKIHLALHYYSYALSYMKRVELLDGSSHKNGGHEHPHSKNFWSDGMARPDISTDILHNTSICAFQAQEFNKAYECMARCVKMSPNVFGKRARCWLRLGQSCIGIYTTGHKTSNSNEASNYTGIGLSDPCCEEDLHSISIDPLQRASFCLFKALHLSSGNFNMNAVNAAAKQEVFPSLEIGSNHADASCFEMALVSLAYVKLQLKDNMGSLALCKLSLCANSENDDNGNSYSTKSLRLNEMAEMYSREAGAHSGG